MREKLTPLNWCDGTPRRTCRHDASTASRTLIYAWSAYHFQSVAFALVRGRPPHRLSNYRIHKFQKILYHSHSSAETHSSR